VNRETMSKIGTLTPESRPDPKTTTGVTEQRLSTLLILYPRDTVSELVRGRVSRVLSALDRTVTVVADRNTSQGRQQWECPFPTRPGLFRHVIFQISLALLLVRNRSAYHEVWLLTGGTAMPIPLSAARVMGKVVFLVLTGSASKTVKAREGANPFSYVLLTFSERITTAFASRVVAYGKSAIADMGLDGWRGDFFTSGAEFVDTSEFPYQGPITNRGMDIGFVGRLSPEKGLANLIEALGTLHEDHPELHLLVAGVGPEKERLVELTSECGVKREVKFLGWIERPRLAEFYGRLRLLVIPSSTEGLPNAMLEAMASGTIVLATRVGAIPDVIRPHVNGFLVDGNSPKSLEEAIRFILETDVASLEQIALNARQTVLEWYTFSAAVERYRPIVHGSRMS